MLPFSFQHVPLPFSHWASASFSQFKPKCRVTFCPPSSKSRPKEGAKRSRTARCTGTFLFPTSKLGLSILTCQDSSLAAYKFLIPLSFRRCKDRVEYPWMGEIPPLTPDKVRAVHLHEKGSICRISVKQKVQPTSRWKCATLSELRSRYARGQKARQSCNRSITWPDLDLVYVFWTWFINLILSQYHSSYSERLRHNASVKLGRAVLQGLCAQWPWCETANNQVSFAWSSCSLDILKMLWCIKCCSPSCAGPCADSWVKVQLFQRLMLFTYTWVLVSIHLRVTQDTSCTMWYRP